MKHIKILGILIALSGVYFLQFLAGDFTATQRVAIVK